MDVGRTSSRNEDRSGELMVKPKDGENIELLIENLGVNGEGIGRFNGFTVFVEGALPGEVVNAQICEVRSHFARASLQRIIHPSLHRETPCCPLFGRCGGCQIMHLSYEQQLCQKRQRVKDALERIGKIECPVADCLPSPYALHYRNKIQLPLNEVQQLGLYARGSHDIIPVQHCKIHSALGEEVFQHLRSLLSQYSFQPLNLETAVEGLKHVLIKTTLHTQEALVVLVTSHRKLLKEFGESLMKRDPRIKGVVQNFAFNDSNKVLGKEYVTLAGQPWIEEKLNSFKFKISPASFFQVNPAQAEILYRLAVDAATLQGFETVLDAYCGVGTLSLFFARHAKKVVGIESVREAVHDARENAKRNRIENCTFIHGKVEEKISSIPSIDVAILNPPRKGCDLQLLEVLIKKRPSRLIYISCDPATLARDLHILSKNNFQVDSVQPVDMFPQTMHVESVATMKLSKSHV